MKRSFTTVLFVCLAFIEVELISTFRGIIGPYFSPLLLFLASSGTAICYLRLKLEDQRDDHFAGPQKGSGNIWALLSLVFFAAISAYTLHKLHNIFAGLTITEGDPSQSDVIPQIMTLTRRFLRAEMPYTSIPFPGYQLFPTYLPLQWLPYCFAEFLHVDYRWIPAIILWFSCLFHFILSKPWRDGSLLKSLSAIWPLGVWAWLVREDHYMFAITVESLIAGYYLFLANAATRRLPWLLAAALCLTLFSRYSLIFWIPVAAFAIWKAEGPRPVIRVTIVVALAFVLIYWLPFLRKDDSIFLQGYHYHSLAALGEWMHLDDTNRPVHLYSGLGLASWAYRFIPGSVESRLAIFQKIHLELCIGVGAALIWWYVKKRPELHAFLLFSLKISLTVFYCFIQIPYKYLFFTPVIVTAVLLRNCFADNRPFIRRKETIPSSTIS